MSLAAQWQHQTCLRQPVSQVPLSRWRHGSGLSLPLSCWRRGSIGREKGHCSLCLVPGTCTGEARARPGLGAVLMCSFAPSMPESCCATLSRRDGWERKGLFSPVCPEKLSALGCAWHEQQVALGVAAMADFSWACCAWLGLCSAKSSLPGAPVGNKSPTNCQQRSKKTVGRAGGSQSQLPLSMVASSVVTVTSGNTANLLCLFLCQVRGELSGRPSWKVRPSSPC